MSEEQDFQVKNIKETKRSPNDIRILLWESDAAALVNLSRNMRKCGYRVVTTTRADDLPLIINNKDEKIDLVLAEFRLIEMNKYELLVKIRSICEIPVVVAGADVQDAVIIDCLCRGVKFYLKKPLMEGDLENLWQFAVRRQRDFLSQIDTNQPEKKCTIPQIQSFGDEPNRKGKNNEVKTDDLDEPERKYPEMQNEFRQTNDEVSQGYKRKERADTYAGDHSEKDYGSALGDQKKPKDLQNKTLEAIPNIEEANNEREEPTETKKNELEKWLTQPVTDFAAFVEYKFDERDFQPSESARECVGSREIPLSPQESSTNDVVVQRQRQKQPHRALKEQMEDGISLADLEVDLQEGHGSTSDLELLDEIFADLAKDLKP